MKHSVQMLMLFNTLVDKKWLIFKKIKIYFGNSKNHISHMNSENGNKRKITG
jgi:hypothetical protein